MKMLKDNIVVVGLRDQTRKMCEGEGDGSPNVSVPIVVVPTTTSDSNEKSTSSVPSLWSRFLHNVTLSSQTGPSSTRPYKKSLLRATSPHPSPPPEPLVLDILTALSMGGNTADPSTPPGALLPLLRLRLIHPHPTIAFKSHTLSHALIRSGSPLLVSYLADHPRDTFAIHPRHPLSLIHI